jgi:hypothetical protein
MAHLALIVSRWTAVPVARTHEAKEQHGTNRENREHSLCSFA